VDVCIETAVAPIATSRSLVRPSTAQWAEGERGGVMIGRTVLSSEKCDIA
jgi:hypothetical protein